MTEGPCNPDDAPSVVLGSTNPCVVLEDQRGTIFSALAVRVGKLDNDYVASDH